MIVRQEGVLVRVVLTMMPILCQQYLRHYRTSINHHEKKTKRRKVWIKTVGRYDIKDPMVPVPVVSPKRQLITARIAATTNVVKVLSIKMILTTPPRPHHRRRRRRRRRKHGMTMKQIRRRRSRRRRRRRIPAIKNQRSSRRDNGLNFVN